METALDGITVLELCNGIAGSYCTKILADYGAEVTKIEQPGLGDPVRSVGPYVGDKLDLETGGLYLYLNTNKRSVTLNLDSSEGVEILKDMVTRADALVESFSPKISTSLGLSYEILGRTNPRLVMTSITPFGQTGPYRDYRAEDLTVWALSGILYETGDPKREPLRIGSNETEYVAGFYGALSTLAALYYRDECGIGQHLDVSAWEAFNTTEPYMILLHSQLGGLVRTRPGTRWPFGIIPCKDGYFGFFFGTQANWESLCVLMEMPELRDKPGYRTPLERDQHADEIESVIASWAKDKQMEDVFHAAQELRLPLSPIPNMSQILNLAQHNARGYFVGIEHPEAGKLTYPGALFKLSETPWRPGRAPLLGEHNEEVYCSGMGMDRKRLARLMEAGIV